MGSAADTTTAIAMVRGPASATRRSGRPFSFNRHDDWRDADDGYGRGCGDRDLYRRSFRSGFESGYTADAHNRCGRAAQAYPRIRSIPLSGRKWRAVPRGSFSPAAQNGYRDGVEAGRDDARGRHAFDPVRAKRIARAITITTTATVHATDYKRLNTVRPSSGLRRRLPRSAPVVALAPLSQSSDGSGMMRTAPVARPVR